MKIEFKKSENSDALSHAYIIAETEEEGYYLSKEVFGKGLSLHSDWMVSFDDGTSKVSMSVSVRNGVTVNGFEE